MPRISPGRELRGIIEADLEHRLGQRPRRVALMLSGGVDSSCVGMAAHELGHRVHAYTFQVGDVPSFDSKWAQRTAGLMGWEWTLVALPSDPMDVVRNWRRMYVQLKCRKKRDFECTYPFLRTYAAVTESHVLSGLVADGHFILSRKGYKSGATGKDGDPEIFDRLRTAYFREWFRSGPGGLSMTNNPSCLWQHRQLMDKHDLVDVNPWMSRGVYDMLMRYSWQELNLPKQKQFVRQTYPEHFSRVGARNHANYQIAGKVGLHFEQLLETPINFKKRSRVIDMITHDWSRHDIPDGVWDSIREYVRGN